ncbi:MAG: ABC transporter ATP-binding protein [Deltaproteobacteria bacterium]|nr:ABC transporter ATP-binding protein [Deltaproteobacteria bacterium]
MNVFLRLLRYYRSSSAKLVLAAFCALGISASEGAIAYLVKPVLDEIFVKKDVRMLTILPLGLVAVYLVRGVLRYLSGTLIQSIGLRVVARIRRDLFEKIHSLSLDFFHKTGTGQLMSHITSDVGLMQQLTGSLSNIVQYPLTIVALLGVAFYREWRLASISLLIFPLTALLMVQLGKKIRKYSGRSQDRIGRLNSILQETFSGARIVKAFGRERHELGRFEEENRHYTRATVKSVRVQEMGSPFFEVMGAIVFALVMWYGGSRVIAGTSTPGTFISFVTAILLMYRPISKTTGLNNQIQQVIAAASRVFAVFDMEPTVKEKRHAMKLKPFSKEIVLKNVFFSYGHDMILKNLDLAVPKGEILAVVGASGVGKSTLVNLIPRFYDVTEGSIEIDGVDIRDGTLESLRSQIAIVTQQTILFNDTIYNSIAYGDLGKRPEQIRQAAVDAHADNFIQKLPQGYDTVIGEQGVRLSGGQQQRIAIARALAKDAPVLILDEATSSLDAESEKEVQKALDRLMEGRTVFVIAHRLSTIRHADRIIVLRNGAVVESGSHSELIRHGGEYQRLYELQFRDQPERFEATAAG